MESSENPVVAVIGATGLQGGSVASYLLDDPTRAFCVRAITRNVESEKARGDYIAYVPREVFCLITDIPPSSCPARRRGSPG